MTYQHTQISVPYILICLETCLITWVYYQRQHQNGKFQNSALEDVDDEGCLHESAANGSTACGLWWWVGGSSGVKRICNLPPCLSLYVCVCGWGCVLICNLHVCGVMCELVWICMLMYEVHKNEEFYSLLPCPHWLFMFSLAHTHTHTRFSASSLSILPPPSYFSPRSCQKNGCLLNGPLSMVRWLAYHQGLLCV